MNTPTQTLGAILLAALAGAAGLTAQTTVKTILDNGKSDNRYDIVILGDGYQAAEQSKFDTDCAAVIAKLFQTEPYKTFEPFFNAHTVFRASAESGADHPDANPPIVKNTVYDASYNTGGTARCLYIKNTSQALRDAALAPAVEGRVMVVVNDSRYGGCAGTFAVTYNGSSMTNVQVHEFGHSFASLADEYDYPNGTYSGSEPSQKNVTKNSSGQKWSKWLGFNGVGAFEGARYYRYGIYRPKSNCIMRTLGQPVCPVCGEAVVLSSYRTVSAIDDPSPTQATITMGAGAPVKFGFTNLAPASSNSTIVWRLDGKVQTSTTTDLTVDTSKLSTGDHPVIAEVHDHTAYVRDDPGSDLISTRTWTLKITPAPFPDLFALSMPMIAPTAPAGSDIPVDSFVQNLGPVVSPKFRVDHFLSLDQVFTTADTYLGGYDENPLSPSEARRNQRSAVSIPAHIPPGNYYLGLVVDRTDAVKELSETNNVYSVKITITAPPCDGRMSYDDPLQYPANTTTVLSASGGVVHPVVTARCNIGDGYLILLSCTGTTPGTNLPLGLNLPLNLDACSDVFYQAVHSPLLAGFLGTIDSAGYGKATLTVPSGLVGTIQGHFAAVLFDANTGQFKRTTDPIEFVFK